jgi:uncharacterized protein (DUF885 family)
MRKILPLLLLSLLLACQATKPMGEAPHSSAQELESLFSAIEKYQARQRGATRGQHPSGPWPSVRYEVQKTHSDSLRMFKNALEALPDHPLSVQEQISKAIMLISLRDQIDQVDFKMVLIPFGAEGGFYNQLAYRLPNLPFQTVQQYHDYLQWLPHYQTHLLEHMDLMRLGIREGIVAPKVIVRNTLELLKPWAVERMEDSPFFVPISQMPAHISASEKQEIESKAKEVIGHLVQTYAQLREFFGGEYMQAAPEAPGISHLPGGKAYYENRVRHYTTLPLTPDSVHLLGLAEVARIRMAMEEIITEVNFKGSFADFLEFLRTDPQFYPKSAEELLHYAAWLSKKAEAQLPKYFHTLYTLPFTVEPVPDNIAPTYTAGRFVPGSWANKTAGIYWVNTYNLPSRTLYTLPALTLHEAVPGHHLQNALAAEIKGIPSFRNRYYVNAFGEGWALYCEYLGEEMGMYESPYDLFGRYTYEMWRACRLVVDTGIHYKGWSREQALKYLAENTALSLHEVTTEIDRYIGWPGQALSYKIGEIKIKALRQKAKEALGDTFDIGKFHDAILLNGSLPMTLLEAQINTYMDNTLKK